MCPTLAAWLASARPRRQIVWARAETRGCGSYHSSGTQDPLLCGMTRPTWDDPAQGAGACFRDSDVSARSPECAPAAGWGPRTPLMASPRPSTPDPPIPTSRSHPLLPPPSAAVAVQTPGERASALGPAPEPPLVVSRAGRGRGRAPGSSPRRQVTLLTLAGRHPGSPRCPAGPTGAAITCQARGAQSLRSCQ